MSEDVLKSSYRLGKISYNTGSNFDRRRKWRENKLKILAIVMLEVKSDP